MKTLKPGFSSTLGIEYTEVSPTRVVAAMPITPAILQPYGFVHGGATIALLESVASVGAEESVDLERERPFGIEVQVRHRKSGVSGMLRGVAVLDRIEGRKQFWAVAAYDDGGDVVSDGEIVTKIVSLERLAEKEREREAAKRTAGE